MQYACNAIISLSTRGVGCVLYVYGSDTRAALARSAPPGPRAKADLLSSARRASDTGCVWTNSIFDWLSGYYSKLLLSNSNMSFNYIKDSSGLRLARFCVLGLRPGPLTKAPSRKPCILNIIAFLRKAVICIVPYPITSKDITKYNT